MSVVPFSIDKPTRLRRVGFAIAVVIITLATECTLTGCQKTPASPKPSAGSASKTAAELFDTGRTAEALVALAATCDTAADTACARQVAQAWETLGEPEQALATLAAVKTQDTTNIANQLSIALKLGDFENAAILATNIANSGKMTSPMLDDVGLALAFTNPVTMDKSLARLPASEQVARLRGLAALCAGRPSDAAKWLKDATGAGNATSTNWYLLGVARRATGDTAGAKSAFQQGAIADKPSLDAAIALAGIDTTKLTELDAKVASVREHPGYWRVVAKDRQSKQQTVSAAIANGYALFYDGLPLEAEKQWNTVLKTATGDDRRELFAALFNSAYKRQDSPLAQTWAERAITAYPNDMWFRKRRIEVLVQQNRLQEAVGLLGKVKPTGASAQGSVSDTEIDDLQCRVLLDAGKTADFEQAIKRYEEHAPDAQYPFLLKGEAVLTAGRSPENLKLALAAYTTATRKAPSDPEAWANRGLIEAELGQKFDAATSLYQAITLWPRVQDGTPHLKLIALLDPKEPAGIRSLHTAEYRRLRALKDGWPTALKLLRGAGTGAQWLEFGRLALDRHENWMALCAFQQAVKQLPDDPTALRGLAMARWRSGWFIASLDATLRANRLQGKSKR